MSQFACASWTVQHCFCAMCMVGVLSMMETLQMKVQCVVWLKVTWSWHHYRTWNTRYCSCCCMEVMKLVQGCVQLWALILVTLKIVVIPYGSSARRLPT